MGRVFACAGCTKGIVVCFVTRSFIRGAARAVSSAAWSTLSFASDRRLLAEVRDGSLGGGDGDRRRLRWEVLVSCAPDVRPVVLEAEGFEGGVGFAAALGRRFAFAEACGFCLFETFPLVDACLFLAGVFAWVPLTVRFGGCWSALWSCAGARLIRPDLRLPSSVKEVGPSASNFFHGGDSSLTSRVLLGGGGGVLSRTLRRLVGRSSNAPSSSCKAPPAWLHSLSSFSSVHSGVFFVASGAVPGRPDKMESSISSSSEGGSDNGSESELSLGDDGTASKIGTDTESMSSRGLEIKGDGSSSSMWSLLWLVFTRSRSTASDCWRGGTGDAVSVIVFSGGRRGEGPKARCNSHLRGRNCYLSKAKDSSNPLAKFGHCQSYGGLAAARFCPTKCRCLQNL